MTTETLKQAPAVHSRGNRKQARRNTLIGWTFILPNFLGFLAFTLIPVLAAFALSFMEWTSFSAPRWVGLENFQRMVQSDTFWMALRNTVVYALGHVPLTMALALVLVLALLLNRKLKGIGFFRVAIFFPYITSLVAVAVVWNMLFSPDRQRPHQPVPERRRHCRGTGLDLQLRLGHARRDHHQRLARHGVLHDPVPGRAAGHPHGALRSSGS